MSKGTSQKLSLILVTFLRQLAYTILAKHKLAQFNCIVAHSQREKQMLLAMLFSTSKCEKSKAKVEMWPLLKHSYSEVEHVPLLLLLISTSLTKVHTGE